MRSINYFRAIDWIARNDSDVPMNAMAMGNLKSVQVIAHCFKMDISAVALDVLRLRTKLETFEWKSR